MQIQIKSIFGKLIFEGDFSSIKEAVLAAVKSDSDLSDADLSDADLSDADLSGANLSGANLRRADLRRADLSRADLSGADLSDANLSDANLSDADLRRADLRRADLSGANLSGADLSEIKADFLAAIAKLPNEVTNLRSAIVSGKIDGSTYEGECACLAGTIANHLECHYTELTKKGFAVSSDSPRERWFLGIKKGDTPENSQISAITLGWIDEFLSENNYLDSGK